MRSLCTQLEKSLHSQIHKIIENNLPTNQPNKTKSSSTFFLSKIKYELKVVTPAGL